MELAIANTPIKQIAIKCRKGEPAIRKYLVRARIANFIRKTANGWCKGSNWQDEFGIDVHALILKYEVANPDNKWKEHAETLFKARFVGDATWDYKAEMRQFYIRINDMDGWIVRTTTKSILLQQKEGYSQRGDDVEELSQRIYDMGLRMKPRLERWFGVELGAQETEFKISSQHWAMIGTYVAKKFREEKKALRVYIDGELRTICDLSDPQRPHLEHVSTKNAPMDSQKWVELGYDINTGKYDLLKKEHAELLANRIKIDERLEKMAELLQSLMGYNAHYAENLQTHVAAIKALKENTEKQTKINEELLRIVKKEDLRRWM